MIRHVYKPSKRKNGKRVFSRLYRGRYRLDDDERIREVPLHTPDKHIAEQRLSKIVLDEQREREGLIPPKEQRNAAITPLDAHLEEWIAMKEQTRDGQYLASVRNRIGRLMKECKWTYAKDIKADDYVRWANASTLSPKSINDYLTSLRTVLNWMVKTERLASNPLRLLDLLPTNGEKRRPRRALSDEEFAKLVSKSPDRGIAYLVAATTGLRFGEMMEVERADVRLDETDSKIVARASTTKNRKEADLPLHPDVAEELRAFRARYELAHGDKVFAPLFRKRGQFKRDLETAGIPRKDPQGRVVDFHSLRHTFCTNLQRLGTAQRVLMHLMRHSDRRLSDHLYTDTAQLPSIETVQKLTVPRKAAPQIAPQSLVPAFPTVSAFVHATEKVNGSGSGFSKGFAGDLSVVVRECPETSKSAKWCPVLDALRTHFSTLGAYPHTPPHSGE